MRIAYLIGSLQRGGAEGQLVHMAQGLKQRGHEIIVITFHRMGRSHATALREAGIRIFSLDFPPMNPLWNPRHKHRAVTAFLRTLKILKKFDPDILHPHLLESDIWMAFAQFAGVPGKFVTSRLSLGIFKEGQGWKQKLQNWTNSRTDAIVCNAQAVADDSATREKYFDDDIVHVIRNGIVWDDFADAEPVDNSQLPFEHKGPVVICVANYHVYKGYADLVNAWAKVASKFPGAHLLCFGRDSGALPDLEKQKHELGVADSVTFHEPVTNVANWLKAADIFAFPSHEEGLPNAVLEALAAGLPIISTRVGGVPEIVEDHPDTCLVPARNPDAMAEKLDDYLSRHPIAPRSDELIANLRKQWSLDRMIEDHERLYRELI